MKKLKVNEKCIACGICFGITDLLVENHEGKAEPTSTDFMRTEDESSVSEAINICPVKAISVIETKVDSNFDINKVAEKLNKILLDVKIDVPSEKDFDFDVSDKDYSITRTNWADGLYYPTKYSSWNQAYDAPAKAFGKVYNDRLENYVIELIVQYKNKIIRPYCLLERSEESYYYKNNKKFEKVLKEIALEVEYSTNGKLKMNDDFMQFNAYPYNTDLKSQKSTFEEVFKSFDEYSSLSYSICKEFGKHSYNDADNFVNTDTFSIYELEDMQPVRKGFMGMGKYPKGKMYYYISGNPKGDEVDKFESALKGEFRYKDYDERMYSMFDAYILSEYKKEIERQIKLKVETLKTSK